MTTTSLQTPDPPLVLASRSAGRVAMLEQAGLTFDRVPADIDEASLREALAAEGATAADAAIVLAETKAARVAMQVPPSCIVLGADQILDVDGRWPDKPANQAAARAQLLQLAGRTHTLSSAVVAFRGGARVWHHVATARLTMRGFGEAFVERYLDVEGDAVLGSVGAYRIEGPGAHLFERIDGDPFTIIGMPLLPLLQFLRDQGAILR